MDSTAQGTAPGAPPPVCVLLTKADAEAIVGKPLQALGPLEFGPTQCAYTPVGERAAVLTTNYGPRFASTAEFYTGLEESARRIGDKFERRPDVGDAAVLAAPASPHGVAWVLVNGRSAWVMASTVPMAIAAAKKMKEKLGTP